MIKLSIWIYALAVTVASLASVGFGEIVGNVSLQWYKHLGVSDAPMVPVTVFFVDLQWKILLITVPFLIAALVLSLKRSTDVRHATVYAGLATLFLVILFCLAGLAAASPFYEYIIGFHPD